MGTWAGLRVVAVIACAVVIAGCAGSHSGQIARAVKSPPSLTPPATRDAVALYNDTANSVSVLGCVGCGPSGTALAPTHWLPLNLPPNQTQLRLQRASVTTCMVIVNGIQTGGPLVVKVSYAASDAC
jgi:hypothetical protein